MIVVFFVADTFRFVVVKLIEGHVTTELSSLDLMSETWSESHCKVGNEEGKE